MRVETGRHTVPKTPENLRICSFCHSDEVENEYHFLFSCTFYEEIRKKIFLEIHEKYSHFNSLDNTSKILFLFNSVDPFICRSTAAFAASSPGLHALYERTELPARGLEPSAIARGLAKNDKKLPDLGEKLPDFAGGKLAFF